MTANELTRVPLTTLSTDTWWACHPAIDSGSGMYSSTMCPKPSSSRFIDSNNSPKSDARRTPRLSLPCSGLITAGYASPSINLSSRARSGGLGVAGSGDRGCRHVRTQRVAGLCPPLSPQRRACGTGAPAVPPGPLRTQWCRPRRRRFPGGLGSEARRRFVEVEPGDVHDGAQTGQEAQDPVRWVNLGVDHPDRLHLVSYALVHVQGKEGNGVVHDGDPGSH